MVANLMLMANIILGISWVAAQHSHYEIKGIWSLSFVQMNEDATLCLTSGLFHASWVTESAMAGARKNSERLINIHCLSPL